MRPADLVALCMARKLADAGLEVRMYLWHGEWTVKAVAAGDYGVREVGFGFRVTSADLLTDPEGYADLHVRKMREELGVS